jgi:undecaprenyl diphosphate synthase
MSQSSWHPMDHFGLHVAIIMDGSGRWACAQGLARMAGHRAGVAAVRRTVEAAPRLGVSTLTLHAFSSENWLRPEREVKTLLGIFEDYLSSEVETWLNAGVRVTVLGRRDRVPAPLRAAMAAAEAVTERGRRLHLRLAIDYSARESIARAAESMPRKTELPEPMFSQLLAEATGDVDAPEVDLLIRTGGELRLSNFFLWECAYAELYFTPVLWPDFGAEHFATAMEDFHSRERRFGQIPQGAVA